jgi:hypothetical protein
MNATLLAALLLQVVAVVLMRRRLGRGWLRRPVAILVISAVAYHGLSEILLTIPSIAVWDTYRLGVEHQYIDRAALYMSAGILALVACYLASGPQQAMVKVHRSDVRTAGLILDWRLFVLAAAPLAVLTYHGRGYNSSLAPGTAATSTNLASTFLIVMISLSAFGFLLRHGMRWFVAVLAAQSIFLAAAGERLPIVVGVVELLVLLAHSGLRPSRQQAAITLALTVLAVLGITGYRAAWGRTLYYENSSLSARVAAVASGLYTLSHTSDPTDSQPGLIAQAANRFDGNAFAGGILQGIHSGQSTLGMSPVLESTLLVVPSVIWPSKLSHPDALSPALTEISSFHLQRVNFLPTLPGLYIGFLGPYWLLVLLAALGALAGRGERWLSRSFSPIRLVVLAVAVQAALTYEKGLPGTLVELRTAVVLAGVVQLVQMMRARAGLRMLADSRISVEAGNETMVSS